MAVRSCGEEHIPYDALESTSNHTCYALLESSSQTVLYWITFLSQNRINGKEIFKKLVLLHVADFKCLPTIAICLFLV